MYFNQVKFRFKIIKTLVLISFLGNRGIYADESILSGVGALGKKLYINALWHDGGYKASFFIPKDLGKGQYLWWDTGTLLGGTQVGYRQTLTSSWLNQKWLCGVYGGFNVMSDFLSNIKNPTLKPFLLYPTRLETGFELVGSRLGQLNLNIYGEPYNPSESCLAKDYFGVSGKLSFNNLPLSILPQLKPFIGFASSYVGLSPNNFRGEHFFSFIIGGKWVANEWVDFEFKYIYDHKASQSPVNFGFQIKFDEVNSKADYFKHQYHRPPDYYIPHYDHSRVLQDMKTHLQQSENDDVEYEINREKENRTRDLGEGRSNYTKYTLDDGTQVAFNEGFLTSNDFKRADKLAEITGLDKALEKGRIANNRYTIEQPNGDRIVIEGGASEEQLQQLLGNDVPVTPLIRTTSARGRRGVGIYGSGADYLHSLHRVGIEMVNAFRRSMADNFATVVVTRQNNEELVLVAPLSGIGARRNAVRRGLLASEPVRRNLLSSN